MPCAYDVAIIGAGPAGVAAAISLSSEGVKVVVLDEKGPGGQVASSSKVENVFGVPVGGLTGQQLMDRGIDQAMAFGAKFVSPFRAVRIRKEESYFVITAANRQEITAASVVLALGVSYRRLDANGIEKFMGRGVLYGSPQYQVPDQWKGKRVGIIGGGNSAGQASRFLSGCEECQVNVFVRGEGLETDMSKYLIQHVMDTPNILVHPHSNLVQVLGNDDWMSGILIKRDGKEQSVELDYLLVQIGAEPHTGWMIDTLELDPKGYILTDRDIPIDKWPDIGRKPLRFETSLPGVFTAGDVHSGSPNRMSVAVGAGHALAVSVYQYLTLE